VTLKILNGGLSLIRIAKVGNDRGGHFCLAQRTDAA